MAGDGALAPRNARPAGLLNPGERYLTAGQVAQLLHVSTKTVHRWVEQGMLPCTFTLGGHRRFRLSDVESAVADVEERRERGFGS